MDSYTPKYVIVQNYINEKIGEGVLKIGDKIPSENELAKMFNCSRMTISTAITQMHIKGVVERIQGKGTFVKVPDNIFSNMVDGKVPTLKISGKGFSDDHKVVSMEVLNTDSNKSSKLMLLPGEKYHRITRLMYFKEKVISFEYLYLPYEFYPQNIDETLIEYEYLHSFIKKYCNKEPKRLQTHINIAYPDVILQKYLKSFKEEPLLLWYTAVIDQNNMILGYTENYARPGDYHPFLNIPL